MWSILKRVVFTVWTTPSEGLVCKVGVSGAMQQWQSKDVPNAINDWYKSL